MKITIIFVFITAFCCSNIFANIVINIDPDELQNIAEILVQSYIDNNIARPRPSQQETLFVHFKKFTLYTLQMVGITTSLVSANLITLMFESTPTSSIPQQQYSPVNVTKTTTTKTTAQPTPTTNMCSNHDFGCEENICWRTCGVGTGNKTTWCYTKARAGSYQHCVHSHDCSPCLECLGPCR